MGFRHVPPSPDHDQRSGRQNRIFADVLSIRNPIQWPFFAAVKDVPCVWRHDMLHLPSKIQSATQEPRRLQAQAPDALQHVSANFGVLSVSQ